MNKQLTQTIKVTEKQTAESLGSGLLPVFSTPALVAFAENTCMKLIDTQEGSSSVGIHIEVDHLKPSLVGETIVCKASLIEVADRKYSFEFEMSNEKGSIIGQGKHDRVIIDIERFMSKLG